MSWSSLIMFEVLFKYNINRVHHSDLIFKFYNINKVEIIKGEKALQLCSINNNSLEMFKSQNIRIGVESRLSPSDKDG